MSTFLEDLYDVVREVVADTWPEVVPAPGPPPDGKDIAPGQIWEAEHIARIPYEKLTPPYAVILVESAPGSDFFATLDAYTPNVEVLYVTEVRGSHAHLREKLVALRDALNDIPQARLQILKNVSLTWGRSLPQNQVFVVKRVPHAAGCVSFQCLVASSF